MVLRVDLAFFVVPPPRNAVLLRPYHATNAFLTLEVLFKSCVFNFHLNYNNLVDQCIAKRKLCVSMEQTNTWKTLATLIFFDYFAWQRATIFTTFSLWLCFTKYSANDFKAKSNGIYSHSATGWGGEIQEVGFLEFSRFSEKWSDQAFKEDDVNLQSKQPIMCVPNFILQTDSTLIYRSSRMGTPFFYFKFIKESDLINGCLCYLNLYGFFLTFQWTKKENSDWGFTLITRYILVCWWETIFSWKLFFVLLSTFVYLVLYILGWERRSWLLLKRWWLRCVLCATFLVWLSLSSKSLTLYLPNHG